MSVVEATLEPTSGSQPLRDLVGELQKACKDIGDLGASLLLLRKWFTVIFITVRFTEVSTGLYDTVRGGLDHNPGGQVLGLLVTSFLNEYIPNLLAHVWTRLHSANVSFVFAFTFLMLILSRCPRG